MSTELDFDGTTPPLDVFLRYYRTDDNWWWHAGCGHHQNLFEEAVEQRDDAVARAEAAEQRLIDAAGFDMADLVRSLDDCMVRAERAEARAEAAEQAAQRVRELADHVAVRMMATAKPEEIRHALGGPP